MEPAPTVGESKGFDDRVAPPLHLIVGQRARTTARGVLADLDRAMAMLGRTCPELDAVVRRTTRRIVVFDQPGLNSLAAPRAHGAVFLNLAHGRGPVCHLEDLLHQCGHVAFQSMTIDPGAVLAVDPDLPVADDGAGGGTRTAYVLLNAVVTERWMASGLLCALRREHLTSAERLQARGRLAYVLRRYLLDAVDLVQADVTTPRGTELLRRLGHDLRALHEQGRSLTDGLNLTGQPYTFDAEVFAERNDRLLRPAC